MKLIIDRKEWRRGGSAAEKEDPTALLCKDGRKCCLGFYALQCGFTPKQIRGALCPVDVFPVEYKTTSPEWLKLVWFDAVLKTHLNTPLTGEAMRINDTADYTEEERESQLTKLFAENGIEVEFNN
jgi:hypothetical protein